MATYDECKQEAFCLQKENGIFLLSGSYLSIVVITDGVSTSIITYYHL